MTSAHDRGACYTSEASSSRSCGVHHRSKGSSKVSRNTSKAPSVVGSEGGDEDVKRKIGPVTLGIMTFFLVCGGPFGMEECVRAAGPMLTLLGFVVMPFVWAVPQSLACAELSCMFSENGGAIIWVQRAFGDFAGWMNAWNRVICNLIDCALYPTLVAAYFTSTSNGMGLDESYALPIKFFVIISCMFFNILGVDAVGKISVVMAVCVFLPFFVELPFRIEHISPSQWTAVNDQIDIPLFMGTLMWAFSGYDDVGSVAGEVKDPGRTYIRGLALALVLTVLTYVLPTVVALTYPSHTGQWHDGYFMAVAKRIAPWLGELVLFSCTLSNYSQCNSNMVSDTRMLWAMGTDSYGPRMLPSVFAFVWKVTGTPVFAITVQSALLCCFMFLDFSILVQADTFFMCINLLFEFGAFIYLKYTEPDTPRAYAVPCGLAGAWAITIPKVLLVLLTVVFAKPRVIQVALGTNLAFVGAYVVVVAYRYCTRVDTNAHSEEESQALLSTRRDSFVSEIGEENPLASPLFRAVQAMPVDDDDDDDDSGDDGGGGSGDDDDGYGVGSDSEYGRVRVGGDGEGTARI